MSVNLTLIRLRDCLVQQSIRMSQDCLNRMRGATLEVGSQYDKGKGTLAEHLEAEWGGVRGMDTMSQSRAGCDLEDISLGVLRTLEMAMKEVRKKFWILRKGEGQVEPNLRQPAKSNDLVKGQRCLCTFKVPPPPPPILLVLAGS